MIQNQRKMMMLTTTRNSQSQWRQKQPKTKEYQSKVGIFQGTFQRKHRSRGGTKTKETNDLEKIMFSEAEPPPGFKVGSNHLILKNIMTHLTVPTLRAARLVCKEWKKLANVEVGRRNCARCDLSCNWEGILGNSDDISWVEFDLNWLHGKGLSTFANLFGDQVKLLKLQLCNLAGDVLNCNLYWNFLSTGAFPNLEILRFDKCRTVAAIVNIRFGPFKWTSNAEEFPPNLKRIEGFALSLGSLFPSQFLQDKGHLVKSLELDSWNCESKRTALTDITLLGRAQPKPKLERLVIEESRENPEFVEQMNLLLESSRESLRTLEISIFSDRPFYFQPQLSQSYSKLSTLHLCIGIICFNLRNQLNCLDQESLPNLKTVQIEVNYRMIFNLPDPLCISPRKRGGLTSVVSLEVKSKNWWGSNSDLVPSNWFPWLSASFPNVKNLTTENWGDTDEVLRHVFKLWPNSLTSLSIHIYYHSATDVKLDLDPIFTGLSAEKCGELKKNPEKMNKKMTKEILTDRKWPNLQSLKELKRLDIILTSSMHDHFWCPVSPISFIYAISLSPELTTTIRFPKSEDDYREFLEPLAPYAHLEGFNGNDPKC